MVRASCLVLEPNSSIGYASRSITGSKKEQIGTAVLPSDSYSEEERNSRGRSGSVIGIGRTCS